MEQYHTGRRSAGGVGCVSPLRTASVR